MVDKFDLHDVLEIPNPLFISDTYVFGRIRNVGVCYIKLNEYDKIEEIGFDIHKRLNFNDVNNVLTHEKCNVATSKHRIIFESISNQYWYDNKILSVNREYEVGESLTINLKVVERDNDFCRGCFFK